MFWNAGPGWNTTSHSCKGKINIDKYKIISQLPPFLLQLTFNLLFWIAFTLELLLNGCINIDFFWDMNCWVIAGEGNTAVGWRWGSQMLLAVHSIFIILKCVVAYASGALMDDNSGCITELTLVVCWGGRFRYNYWKISLGLTPW